MRKAIYPGTFDPITRGHLDILDRGCRIFDEIVLGVAAGGHKNTLFSLDERVNMIRDLTASKPRVSVLPFAGLAVEFARAQGARVILRGIRTVSDFEYEFQMALTNRVFASDLETVFIMASQEFAFVSARLVKESAALGQDVSALVPESVNALLHAKLRGRPS